MTTATETLQLGSTKSAGRSMARILRLETRNELLKLLRMPGYVLPAFLFPLMFYLLFGVALGSKMASGFPIATYMVVSYGAFGVIGASLFSLGVGLATERGQGWMLHKRATPMPPLVHFTARLLVGMLFGGAITVALFTLAATVGGVALSLVTWAKLFVLLTVGGIPFAAMGMALAYLCGPNAAPAVINLVYLPLSFASGLWIPARGLPSFFQTIAPYLPPYHLAQQGYRLIDLAEPNAPSPLTSFFVLIAFTVVCLSFGLFGYRRDQQTYG